MRIIRKGPAAYCAVALESLSASLCLRCPAAIHPPSDTYFKSCDEEIVPQRR